MKRNRGRRFKPAIQTHQEINVMPLVDVALTLLIIFMVATPMMHNIIKVELPTSRVDDAAGKSHTQEDIVVYIDKKGSVFLNGHQYTTEALLKELKKLVRKDSDDVVFVQADQSVTYGTVVDVMDTIKVTGGFKYVALATKRGL